MKIGRIFIGFLLIYQPLANAQVHLSEGFENGSKPEGWTEEAVSGNEPWRYRNGGHSPSDNNWKVPAYEEDITRNPPLAFAGTYNAIFFKQGDNNERTKLITPSMNLLGSATLELSFYLCQIPWTFEGTTGWDVLRIYYKRNASDPWTLLHEFLDPVYEWELQTLVLPDPSDDYYVAFEGHTRWGYGTCIDEVVIQETGSQPLYVGEIEFRQAFRNYTPSDVTNVPMMRLDFKVFGNTGSLSLDQIEFTSLNSNDADISSNGLKLYTTTTQTFSTDLLIGTLNGFSGGKANFSSLNLDLPPGVRYLWLTYDVRQAAEHENLLDVMVKANAISAGGENYPSADVSPDGYRLIYETRYKEDFEGTQTWALTGEFEIAAPSGMGGSPGNPDPGTAVSGAQVLGTDLTGMGNEAFHYEADVSEENAYTATSPNIEALYYKNLQLFFWRYLNIEVWDKASIEISKDDGSTWNTLWENTSYLSDYQWTQYQLAIPDEYSRSDQLKIRYSLGPTDAFNNYSGWNLDDIYLTGEFISKDVGVSEWLSPFTGSGMGSEEQVSVRISNYGGAAITDPVPVAYSFDEGQSWTVDQMDTDIPLGGSVIFNFPTKADLSLPGHRSIMAQTIMAGDQYIDNNSISTELYVIPTYEPPYEEDFETSNGWWRSLGNGIWEHGEPAGTEINSASSGDQAWVTGLSSTYGNLLTETARVIFEDNFETDLNWTYYGEFERNIPSNVFLPYFAYDGFYCIGTDLSGTGSNYYLYENGISAGDAQTATSPVLDASSYSNLRVNFASWITIMEGDSIKLEASPDGGGNWETLWKNSEGQIMEWDFNFRELDLPASFNGCPTLQFRFSLYHSSAAGEVAEGWSIDDFSVTGDLVTTEPAYLQSPSLDISELSAPVITAMLNHDTESGQDGARLEYSIDDGQSWTFLDVPSSYDSYWNWYSGQYVAALQSDGWSGQGSGWMSVRKMLPAALKGLSNVQFRLAFACDQVENQFDGIGLDDFMVINAPRNLDVLELLAPISDCELSPTQQLRLRLRNSGPGTLLAGDTVGLEYLIDHQYGLQSGTDWLVLSADWAQGTEQEFLSQSTFDFSQSGNYSVTAYILEQSPDFYSPLSSDTITAQVQVNKPYVELGEDISTVRADTVVLNAYSGTAGLSYSWQDGSSDSVFHVSTQGSYHVTVGNQGGCYASDTIHVLQLVIDVSPLACPTPLSACELGDQEQFRVEISNTGTDTINSGTSILVGARIGSDAPVEENMVLGQRFFPGQTLVYTFSKRFDLSVPGSYPTKLYTALASDERDYNDTLEHPLEVYGYPNAYLGEDRTVQAASYLLQPDQGYASYLWQDGSTSSTFLVEEPGTGTYHVRISNEQGCEAADTVTLNLSVADLELMELLSPSTSCDLSESITISARLRNAGNVTLSAATLVPLSYTINAGSPVTQEFSLDQDLQPGDEWDFSFSDPETVVTGQWYDFSVYSAFPSDVNKNNDSIHQLVGVFASLEVDLGEDFQLALGFEYILDAGPGYSSYLWQDGSTGQTFTVTQPGIGTYSVVVTDLNGCEASDQVEIMLAAPDVGINGLAYPGTTCHLTSEEQLVIELKNFGNYDLEAGEEIQLTYSLNGSEEVTESIVLNEVFLSGAVILHEFSKAEDFSEPGVYSIMASCYYDLDQIASNDLGFASLDHLGSPWVDLGAGEDTLYIDQPYELTVDAGYSSYLWQDGSTENSFQITEPSAHWYIVTVVGENGCQTRDSVFVIYDVPDLAMNALVDPIDACDEQQELPVRIELQNLGYFRVPQGELITVSYSVDGSASVLEQLALESDLMPGGFATLEFVQGHLFGGPGTYSINAGVHHSDDVNRSNNSLTTDIQVYDLPDVEIGNGSDTIFQEPPLVLDGGSGFASYLWQDGSTGQTYTANSSGWYWLQVTNSYGCGARDSVYVKSLSAIGNTPEFPGELELWPNPAREVLFVRLKLEQPAVLEFMNIAGQKFGEEEFNEACEKEFRMDISNLTPGIYLVRLSGHNFVTYRKLLIIGN